MTVYALTSPQPAATLEAIRDRRPAFLVTGQACPDCFPQGFDGDSWHDPQCEICNGLGTVSPVLPDQPCVECGGDGGYQRSNGQPNDPWFTVKCEHCVEGRVPLPLLITGPIPCPKCEGRGIHDYHGGLVQCSLCGGKRTIDAGLAVLDQPDWLPVVDFGSCLEADSVGEPPCVYVYASGTVKLRSVEYPGADITDLFPSPPEPGGFVVDVSGARWLDEPITTMVCPDCGGNYEDAIPEWDCRRCVKGRVPLSPGSGGLTVAEVP